MQYIINISIFNEIVKGIKAMKTDIVLVSGNTLIGTDNSYTMLKTYTMDINTNIPDFVIISKTLSSEFFNNIIDTNIVIDTDIKKIYCPNNKSYILDKPEMLFVDNMIATISAISCRLHTDIQNPIKYYNIGDITNDEQFQIIKELKASKGSCLYIPNNMMEFGMYLYSGAIPMTESDKINLEIFDLGNVFIAQYRVSKKKSNDVNVFFRFVKLR